ncbi:MAG: murein L,D-transpeptidase family protein [Alphaproteobacteria bacterium]
MKHKALWLLGFLSFSATAMQLPPKPRSTEQVIAAIEQPIYNRLSPFLAKNNLNFTNIGGLTFIYFKKEERLEMYANVKMGNILVKSYPVLAKSGHIGPKYQQGDKQIPEGLYRFTHFNPNSHYHLSLGINYPNRYDKKLAQVENRTNLGGDIMLHGKNVSIGCITIGDDGIEEVFYIIHKVGIHRSDIIMSPVDFRTTTIEPNQAKEAILYNQIKEKLNEFPIPH